MFCTQCGTKIDEENVMFCTSCGAPLDDGKDVPETPTESLEPVVASGSVVTGPAVTEPMMGVASQQDGRVVPASTDGAVGQGVGPVDTALCTACGQPLEPGVAFCTSCGTPVNGIGFGAGGVSPDAAPLNHGAGSPNKKLVIGIVAALLVALVAAGVVLFVVFGQQATSDFSGDPVAATNQNASDTQSEDKGAAADSNKKDSEKDDSKKDDSKENDSKNKDDAEKKEDKAASAANEDFILPDSSTRYYSEAELSELSDRELYIARNEIYARYGRGFKNQDLVDYFSGKDWYSQQYTPEAFDAMASPLNDYERKNADAIRAIETSRNSPYL